MKKQLDVLLLAIKYWLQGDDWEVAMGFARRIVYGFKK